MYARRRRLGIHGVVGLATVLALAVFGCGDDGGAGGADKSGGAESDDSEETADYVPGAGNISLASVNRADPKLAARGKELLEKFECNRCHPGTGLPEAPFEKHCVSCHVEILTGKHKGDAAKVAESRKRIHSLVAVPDLSTVGSRLRRDWVEGYVLEPHDTRPAIVAIMPRLNINADDAKAVAAHLVPAEAKPMTFNADLVEKGADLYNAMRCAECHIYSRTSYGLGSLEDVADGARALATDSPTGHLAVGLATDLAFTRDRFQPGALVAYLMDPLMFDPETTMPDFLLERGEAEALAAFLMVAPLGPEKVVSVPEALPLLTREVRWPEVEERVFRKICWHCHGNPEMGLGEAGAGEDGGFGFKPRGLDLTTPEGLVTGSLDDDGNRRDILAPMEDGTPRIVAHMWARYKELAGEPVDGIRGMPLAFPPLTIEEIQLVASWIAQGRPL